MQSRRPRRRGPRQAALPVAPAYLAGRDAAGALLRQVSEAVSAAADAQSDVIELKLKPEELGQLRFRFGHAEGGLVLNVVADRPETLDLLRRHVDQLARHLSDLGFGSASFSFSDGQSHSGTGDQTAHALPNIEGTPSESPAPPRETANASATDGLDLRM